MTTTATTTGSIVGEVVDRLREGSQYALAGTASRCPLAPVGRGLSQHLLAPTPVGG